jgi:hypothetical protein
MRLKLVFTLAVCALVIIGAGCARSTASTAGTGDTGESEGIMTGIPLAPDFRIADIPVPAEFQFQRDSSFVFQNSLLDVGRIQYAGKEDIGDVAQFYLDEMPRYNWTLLSVSELRTITLFFDKKDKACQVFLSPKVRGTQIEITFFPKAPQEAPEY